MVIAWLVQMYGRNWPTNEPAELTLIKTFTVYQKHCNLVLKQNFKGLFIPNFVFLFLNRIKVVITLCKKSYRPNRPNGNHYFEKKIFKHYYLFHIKKGREINFL